MNKVLVVEDEVNTAELLRRYFELVGYDVVSVQTGKEALKVAEEKAPQVIILDIVLPDMDGYQVCKELRTNPKTDSIPIVFLTQKDERSDRLEGLRLGADDYIAKPFDVEELRLRVHNIIANAGGLTLVDARTSLPNRELIKDRLPKLLEDSKIAFLEAVIEGFDTFKEKHGAVASNQVLRGTAKLISDVLYETGNIKSFIGHPEDNRFILSASKDNEEKVIAELAARFRRRVKTYYDYSDQKRGHMLDGERKIPFMEMKLSKVSAKDLRKMFNGD